MTAETVSQSGGQRELVMLTVRLPKSLHRRVKLEAALRESTAQALVEAALIEYFGVAET